MFIKASIGPHYDPLEFSSFIHILFSEFHSNIIFHLMAYFPKCNLALAIFEKMLNTFHYPLTHASLYEYLILLDFVILAIYMNNEGAH